MLRTQKSHMTYIFICSSLKLLYIGFGYECFFLWKGQTLHTYHQCKALLIKKQAGEFVKVIEILLMLGGKPGSLLKKKKMASKHSRREDGEASLLWLRKHFPSAQRNLRLSAAPLYRNRLGHAHPQLSRACGCTHSPLSETHQALLTPPPYLKPPWNIWRWSWGRYLGQIDANPIWGFRSYAECGSHPRPTCNTRENLGRVELLLLSQKFTGSNAPRMSAAL